MGFLAVKNIIIIFSMMDIPNPPLDVHFLTPLTVHNPVSEEDIANAEV